MKNLSIVVPLYNEASIAEELIIRLQRTIDELPCSVEMILVDDGSSDGTVDILRRFQERDHRIRILRLSRNWGHQNAYNAGLDHSSGDAIVFMDGDLEDPPELIPELVKKWEEGYDVVYAVKVSRHEGVLKRMFFSLFYWLMSVFSDVQVERQAGMFSLLDKKVARQLRLFRERNKYYAGLRAFVGYRQTSVQYHRDRRYAGRPKQTYRRLFAYAMNAFFSFSFLPVRFLTVIGAGILFVIAAFSSVLIGVKLFDLEFGLIRELPGWTSLVLVNFFVIGLLIMFMGILGEYIARIFDEVRNRPYYIVDEIFELPRDVSSERKSAADNSGTGER